MKLVWGTAIVMMGLSASAFAETGKFVDVKTVQSAIKKQNQGWKAKDSWINQMSKEEVTRMMGFRGTPVGTLDFASVSDKSKDTVLDWRNNDGANWLGPVMNQGNCGSCVAFAAVATFESRMAIAYGSAWLRPTFSPAQLFSCGGSLRHGLVAQ